MGLEYVRWQEGFSLAGVGELICSTYVIPRHVRATLLAIDTEAVVIVDDPLVDGDVLALSVLKAVLAEADVAGLTWAADSGRIIGGWNAVAFSISGFGVTGVPTNLLHPQLKCAIHKDFGDLSTALTRLRGVAIFNKGPMSNQQQGWTLLRTHIESAGRCNGAILAEIILEWPPNKSMFFQREHVANEENQDD